MSPSRPEPGAVLDHACLQSPDPDRAAAFLALAYAMTRNAIPGGWECTGPGRTLLVREGPANRVAFFAYAFDSGEGLDAHRRRIGAGHATALPNPSPLFRAAEARFDHLSCETRDAAAVIAWSDRMASHGIPIHWGIGRHGPGNDVFFMAQDPDGNLVEISADLEVCDASRPAGTWRHEQRTLNLWGTAIMRS